MKRPYLLTTDGDKVALYLQLNPLAAVKLAGKLSAPPAPQPHQAAADTQTLYFNDEGRTSEQGKQKDVWNISLQTLRQEHGYLSQFIDKKEKLTYEGRNLFPA